MRIVLIDMYFNINIFVFFFGDTWSWSAAKGNGELNRKDLETMADNCYRKRLEEQDDDQEWSFGDFYRIVDEAVE